MKEPIKWYRCADYTNTNYDHVEKDPNYHAISFVTKHKILFMGFGQFANYDKKDMDLSYQWRIGGE